MTNIQVAKLRKPFTNNYSANTILSKTQLPKIGQSGGVLGRLLGSFIKTGLPFIVDVAKIGWKRFSAIRIRIKYQMQLFIRKYLNLVCILWTKQKKQR